MKPRFCVGKLSTKADKKDFGIRLPYHYRNKLFPWIWYKIRLTPKNTEATDAIML